jgi:hypothetical protein
MSKNLTAKAYRAIASYGVIACREAYRRHAMHGDCAQAMAKQKSLGFRTTSQAEAAINAGRELASI